MQRGTATAWVENGASGRILKFEDRREGGESKKNGKKRKRNKKARFNGEKVERRHSGREKRKRRPIYSTTDMEARVLR